MSATKLPDLVARMRFMTDEAGLKRAKGQVDAFGKNVEATGAKIRTSLDPAAAGGGKLTKTLGRVTESLGSLNVASLSAGAGLQAGVAGGAAAAGAALVGFAADGVRSLVTLAGEVRNFQRASGASAEDSSRFVAVLDDLGISSDAGSSAIFKLGREIAAGAPKLRQFGIEVALNSKGQADFAQTLLNVADAYAKAPDQAAKTAIAFAAFGKQAQVLLPLLEKGRVGLAEFFKGAEQHGQLLSEDDLKDARKLELALDDLQDAMRGLQFIAAKALVPFLTTLSEVSAKTVGFIAGLNEKTGGLFQRIASNLGRNLAGPVKDFIPVVGLLTKSSDEAATSSDELGAATGATATAMDGATHQAGALAEAELRVKAASDEAAGGARAYLRVLQQLFQASEDLIGSQLSVADAEAGLRDSHADTATKERELADAIKAHGPASKEANQARRDLEDARRGEMRDIDDLAKARRDAAVQQAEQAGKTLDDAAKYRIYRENLIAITNTLAPGSPLRVHMQGLIDQLPPPVVKADVIVNTVQADAALEALRQKFLAIRDQANVQGPSLFGPVGAAPVRRHGGGRVNGSGPEVPILAEPGEFVVRRAVVSKVGLAALERLNSLNLRFHAGGMVPPMRIPDHLTRAVAVPQTAGLGGGAAVAELQGLRSEVTALRDVLADVRPNYSSTRKVEFSGPITGQSIPEVIAFGERQARLAALGGE